MQASSIKFGIPSFFGFSLILSNAATYLILILEEINLDIFHFNDATNMSKMFNGCTDEIKRKIQNKMIKIECPVEKIETSKSYFKIKK